jgi:hypothetical protein
VDNRRDGEKFLSSIWNRLKISVGMAFGNYGLENAATFLARTHPESPMLDEIE